MQANKPHDHKVAQDQEVIKDFQEQKEWNFGSTLQYTSNADLKKQKQSQYRKLRETSKPASLINNSELFK